MSGLLALPVAAADLAGLSWGEFIASETNSTQTIAIDSSAGAKALTATMTIEGLTANAEGSKTEASATFSGNFLISQPARLQLASVRATVSGLIIKTAGSQVQVDFTFGTSSQSLTWGEAETKSERYTQSFNFVLGDGKLPTPYEVAAVATVKKPGEDGAALVSVDKISIDIGEALVGEVTGPADSKEPALPKAAPALFASKN